MRPLYISDCRIKTFSSEETPRIDTVREYTEVEFVKRVPWFIYLCSLISFSPCKKHDTDEHIYYVIYIPKDSHIIRRITTSGDVVNV